MTQLMTIPIHLINTNPNQPRNEFDPQALQSLAESIDAKGLINPIAVEDNGNGTYTLIDGERRWRACQLIGLLDIQANVFPKMNGSAPQDRPLMALIANAQRVDLNLVEQAKSYKTLLNLGISIQEISGYINLSVSSIYARLNLLELPEPIQDLFAHNELPFSAEVVRALVRVPEEKSVRLARNFAQRKSTIATILSICRRLANQGDHAGSDASKYHEPDKKKEHFNALSILGVIPADQHLAKITVQTCESCILYDDASQAICKDCPLPAFLRAYIK